MGQIEWHNSGTAMKPFHKSAADPIGYNRDRDQWFFYDETWQPASGLTYTTSPLSKCSPKRRRPADHQRSAAFNPHQQNPLVGTPGRAFSCRCSTELVRSRHRAIPTE